LTAEDFVIRLSSRNAWNDFFSDQGGKAGQEYDFFQIIDKLERTAPDESQKKLGALGFSLDDVNAFINSGTPTVELASIIDNLAARGMGEFVKVDYQVIRGLAYYTGPVFEAFDRKGEFRAIAGGGRYDNLVKLISAGKVDLPALGFGMGDVVLFELLKARGRLPAFDATVDVFVLIEDEALRPQSLKLVQDLRNAGHVVEYALTAMKSDKQFKRSQELKAGHLVKLEPDFSVKVRNLKTREEWSMPASDITRRLPGPASSPNVSPP